MEERIIKLRQYVQFDFYTVNEMFVLQLLRKMLPLMMERTAFGKMTILILKNCLNRQLLGVRRIYEE